MKKYFKKLSKKASKLFLVMVMLFNTFAPYVVKADELSVGKLRLPGSTDYRDSVEVIEGNFTNQGDVQVKKIVTKKGDGKFEIEFQVRGVPYTTSKNAYIVVVFDKSGSMICDGDHGSYSYTSSFAAGFNSTSYTADDNTTIYCSRANNNTSGLLKNKWESAVNGGVSFSSNILSKISTSYVSLVTFASSASNATNFSRTAFAKSNFGHPNGGTALSEAINKAVTKLNTVTETNAEKIIVVISDGDPTVPDNNPKTSASNSATSAKNNGITIYTIGYQVASSNESYTTITESSAAETVLKNVASIDSTTNTPYYYAATTEESLTPIFNSIANKIKENFDAGTNPSVNDGLGSAFTVTGSGATSLNLSKNIHITNTWQTIGSQIVTIDQDAPDNNGGWKETNTGFTLSYTDIDGNTQTITSPADKQPQVYWPQNTYSYTVKYWYEDLATGNYLEDTSLREVFHDKINYRDGEIVEDVLLHLNTPIKVSDHTDINSSTYLKTGYEFNGEKSNITGNIKNNEENVLNVYYKLKKLTYTINHNKQKATDSSEYTKADTETKTVKYGTKVSAATYSNKTYDGYTYNSSKDKKTINNEVVSNETSITDNNLVIDLYYDIQEYDYEIVYHYEGLDETEKDTGTVDFGTRITVTDEMVENHLRDGYKLRDTNPFTPAREMTIGSSTNKIDVYYVKRTDLSYTVNYYEEGTTNKVANSKTVNNKTFGASVTEEAIDVVGYNKVGETTKTITIQAEGNVINFYYQKKTNLSYTVNYYEEGTTNKVANSKTVNNKTFKESVTEEAVDVAGYNKVAPTSQTIEILDGENVINFYYQKKTNLSYTVNYYEEGTTNKVANSKTVNNKTFKESVTENAIDINGYDKVAPTSQTIEILDGENVINFYYKKATYGYTVEYYYEVLNGTTKYVKDNELTENLTGKYLDEISTYTNNVNANNHQGYELDKVTTKSDETGTLPLVISYEVSENIIRVYYKLRVCSYSINYYYDGTKSWTETVNNQKYGVIVNDYDYRDKTGNIITEEELKASGYEFSGAKVNIEERDFNKLVVGEDTSIDVYYVSRNDLGYKVNYLEKGTEKVLAKQKIVENQTFGSVITENAIDIEGYNVVEATTKEVVITTENNEITFYYVKKTNLSYKVNYLEKDTNKVIHDAKTVNNVTFESVVNADDEVIEITGYNYDSPDKNSITIGVNNNVLNLYYTKKTDLSYTVNYLEKDTNKVIHDAKTVNNVTFESVIKASDEVIEITGYNYDSPDKNSITIGENANILNLYYTKKADLSYTVNYLEKDTNKVIHDAKTVNNVTFESVIKATDEVIEITGYNYDSPDKNSITIGVNDNILNLYYTKKNDLSYTVNYLEKDTNKVIHDAKTVNNATFESVINAADEVITITGFEYNSADKNSITIGVDATQNVLNLYYTRNSYDYQINHLEKDTNKVLADPVTGTAMYEDVIDVNSIEINGYKYVSQDINKITISDGNNVANVYYVIDEEQTKELAYKVEYYKDGEIVSSDTEEFKEKVQVLEDDYLTVLKDKVNMTDKYVGYDYDHFQVVQPTRNAPQNDELPDKVLNNTVIKVYYVIQKFDYQVEYYLQNENDEYIINSDETVTVNDVTYGTKVEYQVKEFDNHTYNDSLTENGDIEVTKEGIVVKLYYDINKSDIVVNYTVRNVDDGSLTSFKDFATDVDGNIMEPFMGLDLEDETSTGVVGSTHNLTGRMPTDFVFVGIYEGDTLVTTEENYLVLYGDETRRFTYVYEAPAGDGPPQTGVEKVKESIIFRLLSLIIVVTGGLYTFTFKKKEN